MVSDAGLTLRVSTTGGLEATPESAITRELRSLLVEHKAVIVSALAAPADRHSRPMLDPDVGLPWMRSASPPGVVRPLACPTVSRLHLTTEQAEVAARWTAELDELSPVEFDLFIDHHMVLKAAVREALYRRTERARDIQLGRPSTM